MGGSAPVDTGTDATESSTSTSTGGADTGSTTGGPELGDPFVSGTRLRARYLDGGDVRELRDWWDSELESACTFVPDAEGTWRCMPRSFASVSPPGSFPQVAFLDPECTQPVLAPVACTAVSSLTIVDPWSEACSSFAPRTAWSVGDEVPTPEMLWRPAQGLCVRADVAAESVYELAQIDSTTFVAAEMQSFAVDDELGVEVLMAEDGSSQWIDHHDVVRDASCGATKTPEDTILCIPRNVASVAPGVFEDPLCTSGAVATKRGGDACPEPDFVVRFDDVFEVGPQVADTDVYSTALDGCDPLEEQATYRFYRPGAIVPASQFREIATVVEGRERLGLVRSATQSGALLLSQGIWHDAQIELDCRAARVDEETFACAPLLSASLAWADAACTMPVARLNGTTLDEIALADVVGFTGLGPTCETEVTSVRPIEGMYEGPVWSSADGCTPLDAPPSALFVLIGDDAGPEALPSLPLVTD